MCMKYHNLSSGKKMSLSSAEFSHGVVKVKIKEVFFLISNFYESMLVMAI